jgi:Domain of unknown function (DUF5667)
VRDLTQPLQECLTALDQKRNLQEVLRRYPADRDELISLLRLSVDLGTLGPPPADPGFRLRARNRMLAAAADRRRSRRWNPLASLPRPAARLAFAGALATALALGGLTAAAASGSSLPGDPLYSVKLGFERAQLAVTLDSTARARLQVHFTDLRLGEAQRLIAAGRVQDGVRQIDRYDTAVAQFNRSLAGATLDDRAVADLSRVMDDQQARADASLKALAGSLAAGGDARSAAAVTRTQSHVDQTWQGSKRELQARGAASQPADQQARPAGKQP